MDAKERSEIDRWIDLNFDLIPTSLIIKAYSDDLDAIEILAVPYKADETNLDEIVDEEEVEEPIIPIWGYVFVPRGWDLQQLIKLHAKRIARETGFIVYYAPEIGVYLGINGAGYDFIEAHWSKLKKLIDELLRN